MLLTRTTLDELLNSSRCASIVPDHQVSPADCLVTIYLDEAPSGVTASLRKTNTPLTRETAHLASGLAIVVSLFSTDLEARANARSIAQWCALEVEKAELPSGDHAVLVCMPRDAYEASFAARRPEPKQGKTGGAICCHIDDWRDQEWRSDIVPSFELSHRDLVIAQMEPLDRSDLNASDRAAAIAASLHVDLQSGSVLRELQRLIAEMDGALMPLASISTEDVLDAIEDIAEEEDLPELQVESSLIARRLKETLGEMSLHLLVDEAVKNIAHDLVLEAVEA